MIICICIDIRIFKVVCWIASSISIGGTELFNRPLRETKNFKRNEIYREYKRNSTCHKLFVILQLQKLRSRKFTSFFERLWKATIRGLFSRVSPLYFKSQRRHSSQYGMRESIKRSSCRQKVGKLRITFLIISLLSNANALHNRAKCLCGCDPLNIFPNTVNIYTLFID